MMIETNSPEETYAFGKKLGMEAQAGQLMVQISDLWQFLLFLFPLLATMQLLKLQTASDRSEKPRYLALHSGL